MTIRATLQAARALISDIDHWCQDSFATDNTGCECRIEESFAYCFCALGAISKVTGLPPEQATNLEATLALRDAVLALSGKPQIASWNDEEEYGLAHVRVLKAYDLAIANATA